MEEKQKVDVIKPYPVHKNRITLFEELPFKNESIIFAGDSITQRNEWAEMFNNRNILNRGIDSDNAAELLSRLSQFLKLAPSKIFVMIGINDLYYHKDTNMILNIHEQIIKVIRENTDDTKLYIQSLLPVNNSVYKHPLKNEEINLFNQRLKRLADSGNIDYINIFDHFLDNNKFELDEKYTFDGAHLSGAGYLKWKEQINNYLIKNNENIFDKSITDIL